jgi:phage terminase small subunit
MAKSSPKPAAKKRATPRRKLAPSLTPKLRRFVAEFVIDSNATQAAIRAGFSERTASVIGYENLRKPHVAAAVAAARAKIAQKLEIRAERVLAEAWSMATADARELVEYHVGCCRNCWGAGFKFQRTEAEMAKDREAFDAQPAKLKAGRRFDESGGSGFDARREPNTDCPECLGAGRGRVKINDTRHLSAQAASLYAGVKQTRDGVEVKLHSKSDALERLFKHLGLYDRFKATGEAAEILAATSSASLADRGRAVLGAAAKGDIPLTQAAQLLAGLGALAKLIDVDKLMARVAALEKMTHEPR